MLNACHRSFSSLDDVKRAAKKFAQLQQQANKEGAHLLDSIMESAESGKPGTEGLPSLPPRK